MAPGAARATWLKSLPMRWSANSLFENGGRARGYAPRAPFWRVAATLFIQLLTVARGNCAWLKPWPLHCRHALEYQQSNTDQQMSLRSR